MGWHELRNGLRRIAERLRGSVSKERKEEMRKEQRALQTRLMEDNVEYQDENKARAVYKALDKRLEGKLTRYIDVITSNGRQVGNLKKRFNVALMFHIVDEARKHPETAPRLGKDNLYVLLTTTDFGVREDGAGLRKSAIAGAMRARMLEIVEDIITDQKYRGQDQRIIRNIAEDIIDRERELINNISRYQEGFIEVFRLVEENEK